MLSRFLVFFSLLCGSVSAVVADWQYDQITSESDDYSLSQSISVYVDKDHSLTAEQVLAGEADDLFESSDTTDLNYGLTHDAIWVRFALENTTDQLVDLMFQINYAMLYHVHFFYQTSNNELKSTITGLDYLYYSRPVNDGYFIFPLQLEAKQKQVYYLKVKSYVTVFIPLKINTPINYDTQKSRRHLLIGAYMGLIVAMFFYNLFLYFSIKDSAYLYYIIFIFSSSVMAAQMYGFGYQFWPTAISINERLLILSLSVSVMLSLLFSRSFLQIKKALPRLDKYFLQPLIFITVFNLFLSILLGYRSLSLYMYSLSSIILPIIAVLTVIRMVQGYKPARFFALAWLIIISFAQFTLLVFLNIINYHPLLVNLYQIGHSIEVVLLSFALADRINILKKEKVESEQAAQEAKKLGQAKSDFLAKMSHEIRTPMNGVLGMAELLRSTQLQPLQKHYADVIHGSGKALLSVINDILDHAKIEAGKLNLEKIAFDLDALIHDCVSVFAVMARDKNLKLLSDIRADVPIGLMGDPTRLRQILLNLLSNAFKFTKHGEIVVRVILDEPLKESNVVCRFEVKDTGIGITPEDQTKLFQPFSQTDSSITRRFGGTGLGLTIARQITELMEGEIGIDSIEGEGSTFWFTAHLSQAQAHELNLPKLKETTLNGKRLLVIDDHPTFCEVIKQHGEAWGMTVEAVYLGDLGLAKLIASQKIDQAFDVLILDMHLPDIEGLELAQKIHELEELRSLPILLVTGVESLSTREVLQELGICLALEKPLSNLQLKRALIEVLSGELEVEQIALQSEEACHTENFSELRILVAEDNAVNQLVIEGMLHKLGVNPQLVVNGLEAVEQIKHHHSEIDLVLMDCEMPELDGYEATRQIRTYESEQSFSPLPIIALTAHVLQEHREKSTAAGMNDYLSKPLQLAALRKLLLAIKEALNKV